MRRHGRGRTLSGTTLSVWTLERLGESEVLKALRSFEYRRGVAREEELFRRLKKRGLSETDIKKSLGSLIREGEVYSPRPFFYKRTSYQPRKKKVQK